MHKIINNRLATAAIAGSAIVLAFIVFAGGVDPVDELPGSIVTVSDSAAREAQTDEYGMPVGLYEVVDGVVKRNQTFTDLLDSFNIDYVDAVLTAQAARDVFDVRRIRAGKSFRVYSDKSGESGESSDSDKFDDSGESSHSDKFDESGDSGAARFLVYDQDKTSYVVFRLSDDLGAEVIRRPTEVRRRTITGTIYSSLYETLLDQDVNPILATRMSEVFAWQIDFYRIQRGDAFRVVYDEIWVGNEQIDVGSIHAARFEHFGSNYYAFHYTDEEVDDYYDADGQSVRKAFLIAPVSYSRISSGFSGRRYHPVLKRYRSHLGTDYAAPYGTRILATGDGVVEVAGFTAANGNWVKIRHNGTYTTGYLHMSKIKSGIRPGVKVKQGQTIGYVGSTGLANGNHVCYRFWKDKKQVDHRREKLPSVGPIRDEYRPAFEEMKSRYMVELGARPALPFGLAYTLILRESGVSSAAAEQAESVTISP